MSFSMVTGWANTAEIISVLKNDAAVDLTQSFEVTPNDVVEVKVKITDGADPAAVLEAVEATFLTYKYNTDGTDGALLLDNTTIQYVDQQTTAKAVDSEGNATGDAYATFTFRPRMNGEALLLSGAHTAMVGGTAVDLPTPFSYTVAEAKIDMTVTGDTKAYIQGNTSNTAFTLNLASDVTPSKVMLGSVELTASDYTYESGTLTILATYLNTLAVTENTSYALVVSATGYNDGTLAQAITINALAADEVPVDKQTEVNDALKEITIGNGRSEIELPTVQAAGYDVSYAIVGEAEGVSISDGKLVLNTSVKPFAKVDVQVYAGTGEACKDVKTVYLIPEPEKVGFGNIGLHTAGIADPFVYDSEITQDQFMEKVNALDSTAKANDLATALNIVLYDRQADIDALPHFESALDYVKDGKLTLAEYRIYKLMMEGNSVHTFEAVNTSRANYNNTTAAED